MGLFSRRNKNEIKFSDNVTGSLIILHSNGDHAFSYSKKATELIKGYIPGVEKVFTREGDGTRIDGSVLRTGEMILRFPGPKMVYLNNNEGTGFALLVRRGMFG